MIVDKDIIEEMHERYKMFIDRTSSQRVRSSNDIQYGFMYSNYLMSATKGVNISQIFDRFDVDKSK